MRHMLLLLTAACASAPPPAPAPAPAPAPGSPPVPVPVEEARVSPAPAPPPAPVEARPCNGRKATYALARASGMGSYLTTLTCGENGMFTVVSDRATPDGREVKQAFQVTPVQWEEAWRGLEEMRWRTLDDRCTAAERAAGRGDGPVYRIMIEDGTDKRTFICAGMRELVAPLDAVQAKLTLLAPAEQDGGTPFNAGVGVAECDDYLTRYKKCVREKVPTAQRQGFLEAIDLTERGLRDTLLRNPDSSQALANQCRDMMAAARAAMAGFKCKL